jgi:hypothetical protein
LNRLLVATILGAMLCAIASGAEARRIKLKLVERLGVERKSEPVTTGIPIPRGELASAQGARLLLGGREVPAQFRAAGLWRPGENVKWLLVDFQADLAAKGTAEYILEYGEGVAPKAKPKDAVEIKADERKFEVLTGAATFWISRERFSLFELVNLDDGTVIIMRGRKKGSPRNSGSITGLRPAVTRAVPGKANRGKSHLIYVKNLVLTNAEDYTLTFTTNKKYVVKAAKSGAQGVGEYRKAFTSKNGAISIPKDAWLNYAYAQPGDSYLFRTVPEGTAATSLGVFSSRVLEKGPMRSCVELRGFFAPTGSKAPLMEYTARYHFYAGSARCKLVFTMENNSHGGRTDTGNARNSEIGGINCVSFDAMHLDFDPFLANARKVRLLGDAAAGVLARPLDGRLVLYQDSSGGAKWNRYRDKKFHPRPNSYVSFRGYQLTEDKEVVARGQRALGCLDLSDGKRGVAVAVRDFWQNFPKSFEVSEQGVRIGLFPGRYAGHYSFRSGEHKTHEMLFAFHKGKGEEALAAAMSLNDPLRLEPSPAWYAKTGALGALHPRDVKSRRAYEVRNLSAIGEFPAGVKRGASLFSRREQWNFYGWMDYGDVPMDFETASGQWGMKYDMDYHLAQQYARSLDPRWWLLFGAAARHVRDIDIHHQPHHPGLHFVKGGTWAHSLHNEAGHKNPNRNRNHFTKDLAFGARGSATYHYMTGDWKAHDACLELAENALARYMSPQKKPDPARSNRMGWRGDACTLNRLLEGWLLSGEKKYLERAKWQIASCAFDGKPKKHKKTSLWSSTFYMMALWRYVQLFPEDKAARSYLLAHIETLRKGCHSPTGMYYAITPKPDGSVEGRGTVSHYNIMGADALTVGYLLTKDMKYMETARRCFAYGVKHACWKNGPPTYQQVHSANGAMHGNLFMSVDASLKKAGK